MIKDIKFLLCILSLLVFFNVSVAQDNPTGENMKQEKVTKRVGSLIKVKPEFEERYIILHKYTFPGVLERIRKSNIRNYSIFLLDGILFSYYEYVSNNYDADMKAIADPTTKDWWKLTDPMQEPLPTRKEGEWWAEMEQWFCYDKLIKPSSQAQRIGLVAEIIPGKEEEVKNLFNNFPKEINEATSYQSFQNNNIFFKDNKIYFYYEYAGDNIRSSFTRLSQFEKYQTFQAELNKLLLPKGTGNWEIMKEVFHTD